MLFFALLTMTAPVVAGDLPRDLPVDVVVPTPTEAAGVGEIYAVREGKLWMKKTQGPWTLYGKTGLPPGTTTPVIAVFADEDEHFTVVTADSLMHHHENGAWDSLWGLPSLPFTRAPLSLPVSSSSLRPGRVAYSMRHKNVLFYEDTRGAQFHWGDAGTTSLFVLDHDGNRLMFGDPWLPPDFSREICAPEKNALTMASVAASASTLFVVGVDGSMYTRFDDYDHNGGTPLFSYDYRPARSAQPPPSGLAGTDLLSAAQVRGLPGDDWHEQPPIDLSGKARQSRNIAVVQNGQGNNARELRVVGDDAGGARGVYTKPITAARWTFTARNIAVSDDAWLDPHANARHPPPSSAPSSYAGFLRGASSLPRVYASTDDFSFHCSPFHMTLDVDGVDVRFVVHAVDAWTVFTEVDPVDDDVATKRYKITLFLDEHQHLTDKTRAQLDEIFQGALEAPFAFAGMANQHELVIVPVSYPVDVARARWSLVLRSDPSARALNVVPLHPATKLARKLLATAVAAATSSGVGDVDGVAAGAVAAAAGDVLARCASDAALRAKAPAVLAAVRASRAQLEQRLTMSRALEAALPSGTALVDVGTVVSTLRFTWPLTGWLDSLELHLPSVLGAPALAYERIVDGSRADYDAVERALSVCGGGQP